MSIRDEIARYEAAGALVLLKPLLPGAPHVRLIYTTPTLYASICGPWEEDNLGHRMGFLHRDLDRFSTGEHVTVGHGKDEACDLKPLDPEGDEVWEFRSRAPNPSYRLFGGFAATDVLFLSNMESRGALGHRRSREWAVEIGVFKAAWRKHFPWLDRHYGDNIHAYISAPVTDLRDIESR
jgi:hypothetical protein